MQFGILSIPQADLLLGSRVIFLNPKVFTSDIAAALYELLHTDENIVFSNSGDMWRGR